MAIIITVKIIMHSSPAFAGEVVYVANAFLIAAKMTLPFRC